MIVLSPKLESAKEISVNKTAQARYPGPFGNIPQKVSAQLVIRPTDVLRQASVTVAARITRPALPR